MLRSHKPHHRPRSNSYTRLCTRYGTLHLLRDAAPDQNGCTAYGSGAPPTLTSTTVANAPPLSPHSPIPHVIPWRPDFVAPQKPQNSNVSTSKVETPAGELHAKCGGRARAGTQRQKRHTQHSGTQQTPAATRLRGLSFSSLPRTLQLRFHSETPRMPRCIETRRHQRQSCNAQRASR